MKTIITFPTIKQKQTPQEFTIFFSFPIQAHFLEGQSCYLLDQGLFREETQLTGLCSCIFFFVFPHPPNTRFTLPSSLSSLYISSFMDVLGLGVQNIDGTNLFLIKYAISLHIHTCIPQFNL
jgi:hypothetical protein